MSLCQLTDEMKTVIRGKLEGILNKAEAMIDGLKSKEVCLLCEITSIVNMARDLEAQASFYHFQSSLLPYVEGLDEIIKALATLSSKGHGALIAVERNDNLESSVNSCHISGIPIKAEVSAHLLQSIFYPGSPLHDGAVLIRDKTIVSAGCLLPLSEREYSIEGKKLGTRHRAAIGLSERTDALLLIVSEETGQVSFALNGRLHPIEVTSCSHVELPLKS